MAKYIDSDAFLSQERAWYCDNCDRRKNSKGKTVYEIGDAPCRACDIGDILDLLEDYPSDDVVERKRGKWIYDTLGEMNMPIVKCSECELTEPWFDDEGMGFTLHGQKYANFCPNCGADMRGDNDV